MMFDDKTAKGMRYWLRKNCPPLLMCSLYLVLAGWYSIIIPIFEASDENNHFFFARYLSQMWRIPDVRYEEGYWGQQATQGPLYYLVAAVPIAFIETSDAEYLVQQLNPFVNLGDGLRPGNKNAFLHDPNREKWPWTQSILAVHAGRLVSALFGVLLVWWTYYLVFQLVPRAAGAAALLTAVLPQLVWCGGVMTNDVCAGAMCAWAICRFASHGQRRSSVKDLIVFGMSLGFAVLAKTPGLVLALYMLSVFGLLSARAGLTPALRNVGWVIVPMLALAGPWLFMNLVRYGDPTGLSAHLSVMNQSGVAFFSVERWGDFFDPKLIRAIPGLVSAAFTSLWGVFGVHNILAPSEVYESLNWLALAAFVGFVLALWRPVVGARPDAGPIMATLVGWLVLHFATLIYWAYRSGGGPGRLLFPAWPVIALFLSVGWLRWADWVKSDWLNLLIRCAVPGMLAMFALTAPDWLIKPAYAAAPAVEKIPATAVPLNIHYGDLELVGIDSQKVLSESGDFTVTFYWRLTRPTSEEYIIFPRLLDHQLTPVAGANTYPGWGNWPVKFWEPGQLYADTYKLPVAVDAARPGAGRVILAVERGRIPVTPKAAGGAPIDPAMPLAYVAFPPVPEDAMQYREIATFDQSIALLTAKIPATAESGSRVLVSMKWKLLIDPAQSLKRFLHLDDGDQLHPVIWAQNDAIPANGYEITWWPQDMVVPDNVTLALRPEMPNGKFALWVGFVRPDGERVPVVGGENLNGRLLLGWITVESNPK